MNRIGGEPEIQGVSIVALGSFNPAIFQPLWFSGNGLIPNEEAKNAKVNIIHNDVSVFATEWFSIQVTGDRYVVETKDPTKYQPLKDLALGTFNVLEHTPITAFGLNKMQGFRMGSLEDWHAFGDYYVPKGSWRKILVKPGMRTLIVEGKRENCDATVVQIRVEPWQNVPLGVSIHVNEHYQIEQELQQRDRIEFFLKTLQSSWSCFLSYCDEVDRVLFREYTME
jgi:hypothetical protein